MKKVLLFYFVLPQLVQFRQDMNGWFTGFKIRRNFSGQTDGRMGKNNQAFISRHFQIFCPDSVIFIRNGKRSRLDSNHLRRC